MIAHLVSDFARGAFKVLEIIVPQHFARFWNFFVKTDAWVQSSGVRAMCGGRVLEIPSTDQEVRRERNRTTLLFSKRIILSVCTHTRTYRGVIGTDIEVLRPPGRSVGGSLPTPALIGAAS